MLLVHWAGGRHSELRIQKNGLGKHQRCTGVDAIEVVRQMSGKFPDEEIAATLNRLGLRTGAGNTWSTQRVYSLRHYHDLPNNKVSRDNPSGQDRRGCEACYQFNDRASVDRSETASQPRQWGSFIRRRWRQPSRPEWR